MTVQPTDSEYCVRLRQHLNSQIENNEKLIEQYSHRIDVHKPNKSQARPLTRYLPQHGELDLRKFIEGAGHNISEHISLDSHSCRGYLNKMGGRIRTWKKRWFSFDREKRALFFYTDHHQSKVKGAVYFQAIEDVYVDHLHKVKSRSPGLTFCIKTQDRNFYLAAPSVEAMGVWIDVIFTGAEGYKLY